MDFYGRLCFLLGQSRSLFSNIRPWRKTPMGVDEDGTYAEMFEKERVGCG